MGKLLKTKDNGNSSYGRGILRRRFWGNSRRPEEEPMENNRKIAGKIKTQIGSKRGQSRYQQAALDFGFQASSE